MTAVGSHAEKRFQRIQKSHKGDLEGPPRNTYEPSRNQAAAGGTIFRSFVAPNGPLRRTLELNRREN